MSRTLALREKCSNVLREKCSSGLPIGKYGLEKIPYLDTFHAVPTRQKNLGVCHK